MGVGESGESGPACHRVLYASWQLDFTKEVFPSQGTVYIWKEQSVFCEREERGIVRVTVKKERAQLQDVRSVGEKGGGGTPTPTLLKPSTLSRGWW